MLWVQKRGCFLFSRSQRHHSFFLCVISCCAEIGESSKLSMFCTSAYIYISMERRVYIFAPSRFKYHRKSSRHHKGTHTQYYLLALVVCDGGGGVCRVALPIFPVWPANDKSLRAASSLSCMYFSPAAAAVDIFSHHLIRANINEEVKYCTLCIFISLKNLCGLKNILSLSLCAVCVQGERARARQKCKRIPMPLVSGFQYFSAPLVALNSTIGILHY